MEKIYASKNGAHIMHKNIKGRMLFKDIVSYLFLLSHSFFANYFFYFQLNANYSVSFKFGEKKNKITYHNSNYSLPFFFILNKEEKDGRLNTRKCVTESWDS